MKFISTILISICASAPFNLAHAIINGTDVNLDSDNQVIHVVALQMQEIQLDGSTHYYKGSAVLISEDTLLTAAHNVAYIADPKNIEAIFSVKPCWGSNLCHEERVRAVKTVVHPLFRQIHGGTEFDIAIIKLQSKGPAPYTSLNLISREQTPSSMKALHVLGFGTNTESPGAPLDVFRLRAINLNLLETSYKLGSEQKFWLDQRAGGICAGDSGGPAIIESYNLPAVVGIAIHVTYDRQGGHCLTKGAFSDVLFFDDWIKSNFPLNER